MLNILISACIVGVDGERQLKHRLTFRPRLIDKLKGAKDTILYRNLDNKGLEGSSVIGGKGKTQLPIHSPNGQFNFASDGIKNFKRTKVGNRGKSKSSSSPKGSSSPDTFTPSTESVKNKNVGAKKTISVGRFMKGRDDRKEAPAVPSTTSSSSAISSNEAEIPTMKRSEKKEGVQKQVKGLNMKIPGMKQTKKVAPSSRQEEGNTQESHTLSSTATVPSKPLPVSKKKASTNKNTIKQNNPSTAQRSAKSEDITPTPSTAPSSSAQDDAMEGSIATTTAPVSPPSTKRKEDEKMPFIMPNFKKKSTSRK